MFIAILFYNFDILHVLCSQMCIKLADLFYPQNLLISLGEYFTQEIRQVMYIYYNKV